MAAEWLGLSPQLVCCLLLVLFSKLLFNAGHYIKRYIYDYKTLVAVTLLSTVGSTLFGVVAVVFVSPTAEARVLSNTIVMALIGIALYYSVFKKERNSMIKEFGCFH